VIPFSAGRDKTTKPRCQGKSKLVLENYQELLQNHFKPIPEKLVFHWMSSNFAV
jgi:hypothetical protein